MQPGDRDKRELTKNSGYVPKGKSGCGSHYKFTVRGDIPDDLVAKVSALHADAILSSKTVDCDESP